VKIVGVILFLILFVPVVADAQVIKVKSSEGVSISDAIVYIRELTVKRHQVFITDARGAVKVTPASSPVELIISHVSYLGYADTLNGIYRDSTLLITLTPKDLQLKEVVVTSEMTTRSMEESVNAVNIINKERIESQAAVNLEEVLGQELTMRISQDPVLGAGLNINGLTGQNIKFLIDGVPVIGRLDGNIDISQLNLNNIERIEIVNGPMSALYGTDAAGGVINLITRKAVNNKYLTGINLYYENAGQYNVDGFAGYSSSKSSIMVTGGRNFFDGWSERDTGRFMDWKPKEQYFGSASYKYKGKNFVAGYQVSAFDEKISNKGTPRVSPYFAYAFDEYYKTLRLTNQADFSYMPGRDKSVSFTIARSGYRRIKNTYRKDLVSMHENLVSDTDGNDTTKMTSWMSRGSYSSYNDKSPANIQAGFDLNYENATGVRFSDEGKSIGDYAVFASVEYKASGKLLVKPAVRIAYNTNYKAPVVPSVSFKYNLSNSTQIRLSYGKGFRAPGIKELYLYFVDINHNVRGNESLLPEYSDNFYASVNKSFSIGKFGNRSELSGFYNDIRNLITLAQPDPENSLFTYINLGKFSTHGVAASHTVSWNSLSLTLGTAYTGRFNIYSDSGAFKRFIYSPDYNGRVNYHFEKADLSVSVFFKYNGKLPGYRLNSDNTITQFTNDSYRFLDATIRKGFFKKKLFVAAGVKNILNVTTVSSYSQNTAHSSSDGELDAGTGRTVFAKLQYQIGK